MAHPHNTADGAPTPWSSVSNRYRLEGTSYTAANFGRIDIDWTDGDALIRLSLRNVDGAPVYSRSLRLSELQPKTDRGKRSSRNL